MRSRLRILARIGLLTWAADPVRAGVALVLTVFDYASPAVAALGVRRLVDAASHGDPEGAAGGIALLVLTVAAGQGAGFGAFAVGIGLRERVAHRLERDIAAAVAARPGIEHLERAVYLDRLSLLREQAPNLARLQDSIIQVVGVVARLGATAALLATVDPRLLLLIPFALPSLAANLVVERLIRGRDDRRAVHQRRAWILDWYVRSAGPAKEIRIFGAGEELRRRIHRDRTAADNIIRYSNIRIAAVQSVGWAIFGAGFVVALLIATTRATQGEIGIGDLAMVVTLGAQLNGQLGAMSTWLTDLLDMFRAADHYQWLIETGAPETDGNNEVPKGTIELQNISFRYPGTSQDVLTDVTLSIPAGTAVAIVGDNGAGKTTLLKLLMGLYEPTSGHITNGGMDIAAIDPRAWRQHLSGAFQDTPPLELKLREVVGIGDVTRIGDSKAVIGALARAGASELRETYGIDIGLGKSFNDGVELSGGEWQKLALARAMMRADPRLLMLDEPTANLDPQAEHAVFERYASLAQGDAAHERTTILISHRFSTVQMADSIIVLDKGHIAEHGTHQELMLRDGIYAELFTLQARGYQ